MKNISIKDSVKKLIADKIDGDTYVNIRWNIAHKEREKIVGNISLPIRNNLRNNIVNNIQNCIKQNYGKH